MDTRVSGRVRTSTAINVTPLIDVLLVLLIIFMVIQPSVERGLAAAVPQQPQHQQAIADPRTLVLEVSAPVDSPTYRINGEAVGANDLAAQLHTIFAARDEKVLFVKGGSTT